MTRSPMAEWYEFAARELLAAELAEAVAARLSQAIERRGHATLAVSGGSTPSMFFRSLARKPVAWKSVTVTLVDERFVPPSSERSNERLATINLLQADAAAATFVGLYSEADIVSAAKHAGAEIGKLMPFDVIVLGMGTDGHTASFFNDAGNLQQLLDPNGIELVLPVQAAAAGEPRLTLTLAALSSARHMFVHIEGLEKKELLRDVLSGQAGSPISAVIEHASDPVDIYWAPGD